MSEGNCPSFKVSSRTTIPHVPLLRRNEHLENRGIQADFFFFFGFSGHADDEKETGRHLSSNVLCPKSQLNKIRCPIHAYRHILDTLIRAKRNC